MQDAFIMIQGLWNSLTSYESSKHTQLAGKRQIFKQRERATKSINNRVILCRSDITTIFFFFIFLHSSSIRSACVITSSLNSTMWRVQFLNWRTFADKICKKMHPHVWLAKIIPNHPFLLTCLVWRKNWMKSKLNNAK